MKQRINDTFSYKVRAEAAEGITGRKKSDACLLAFLISAELFSDGSIEFKTECEICLGLFKRLAQHASENEEAVSESIMRSRGRLPCHIVDIKRPDAEKIASRLGMSGMNRSCLLRAAEKLSEKNFGAFAAGIFMVFGSVSSPDKEYNLSLNFDDANTAQWVGNLFEERLGIVLKLSEKQNKYCLYIRDSEGIEDILTLIGAPMSSLEIMNVKIYKSICNRVNRAMNCDTANCERQNRSAARQIEAIRIIETSESGLLSLSDDLRVVAEMRLNNPECNLKELAELFDPPLSKSGVNHRLKRIEEIAGEIINKGSME